jgi:acetyl-CoA carboxylase carboxyltransferase component
MSSGVECMITANIPTLQGGAWNAMTMARGQRISEIAWINRLPHIQLVQSVKKTLKDGSSPMQIAYNHQEGNLFTNHNGAIPRNSI